MRKALGTLSRNETGAELVAAARALERSVGRLRFARPVTHVYNPLSYARRAHTAYLERYGARPKRVVFLGMNPGPFGMAQTGVPFGAVEPVRDWLRIEVKITRPRTEHPKRPVLGLDCPRNEVSGERLWGAIQAHWKRPARFFDHHFVANYCPLLFLEESGRNRTPDKLAAGEREPLFAACDRHLARLIDALDPEWVVGIGAFAERRAREVLGGTGRHIGRILHPSPANPRAQRDWAGTVRRELAELGVCPDRGTR
ncbi:MAG: uracil-DNA glycosylase family protein [Myxococcota bacterium]|jgi:single-strand selective monofunctional uracil DNA glycosylase|nr:single-stranded DNA-binding protein [Deltaproteobacteria bacterium]MCP4242624.1 single-stranded DNA-binding protein [bacterium]MDP6074299.1 uracil-DNA glycosylase family protein [Myxococcota bacterium]MDP6243525.1 uracil-DNA glycosylase family protein [Myxococcota bacterium]MDP7073685.1 uracil-DNA glycosylase family protein [Myxococcota bacterium]